MSTHNIGFYREISKIIIHPILLSNQSAPVAPGDFKIKSHIHSAASHISLCSHDAAQNGS